MASNPYDQFDGPSANPYDQFDSPQQEGHPFAKELGRQAGLAGRAVTTGLAALPLTALEGGAYIGNLVNRAIGQDSSWSPMQQFERGMDSIFPRPQGAIEQGVQVAGSMIAGARIPGPRPITNPATGPADSVIREGVQRHVPVYFDDVSKSSVVRKVGTAAESLGPLGTGSGRAVQAKAAQAAADDLVSGYSTGAGDDVPTLIQQGMRQRLGTFKKISGKLYDEVDAALAGAGPVDTTRTKDAIAAKIAKEQSLGSAADKATISTLQKYLDAPPGDFAHWRELRSALGADISDYYTGKGAGAIGQKGAGALQEVKSAMDADMAAHAQRAGGAGYGAWRKADQFYRANIVPFKEAGFKDLANTAEPEKVWRYLLANNTESRAVRMLNGLNKQGRAAVKYGLVRDAAEAATTQQGTFSPAKFAQYIERHDNAVNTFFKGADRRDIDGFVNLMRHVERAGQFAENPPTGNRLVPFLVGGAAFMEPTSAAAVAGTGLTARGLFQTKAGRDFLISASRLRPGTPEMQRLLEATTRYAASASVSAQASGNDQ